MASSRDSEPPGDERPGSGLPDAWPDQRGWWLDDAVPGVTLRHPGGRTLDETDHVWLAWVSLNASDIHGNADLSARGPWGQPIVLGALTAAIVLGLAAPAAGPPEVGTAGWSDGWSSIRLSGAVLPGDTLRAESYVHAVDRTPDAPTGRVQRTIRGLNQRGQVVLTVEEVREVARRPAVA
jgi:acyl dehydratase